MSGPLRLVTAFGAFIATVVASATTMAVVLAVVRLWLEGDGKPSWLFKERNTFVGPSSPADLLLVFGSIGIALVVALLVWQVTGKR